MPFLQLFAQQLILASLRRQFHKSNDRNDRRQHPQSEQPDYTASFHRISLRWFPYSTTQPQFRSGAYLRFSSVPRWFHSSRRLAGPATSSKNASILGQTI